MGGGPSKQQTSAATSQQQLAQQQATTGQQQQQFVEKQQNAVNPFYGDMMQNGTPYYANQVDAAGGSTARAFAPARAQLERSIGQGANAMPSGFATGARMDLASNQGRAFDDQLQGAQRENFQAKQQGAAGMLGQAQIANPLGYSGQAQQGYGQIMNAPLAKPGLGGLLGGLAGGFLSNPAF